MDEIVKIELFGEEFRFKPGKDQVHDPVKIALHVKEYIDDYLISCGRGDIIRKIIELKKPENEEFAKVQLEKLSDIEKMLEDDF